MLCGSRDDSKTAGVCGLREVKQRQAYGRKALLLLSTRSRGKIKSVQQRLGSQLFNRVAVRTPQ